MSLIADRLNRISPSQTIAITEKARALKAEGRDIISLSAGEPDFDTPDNVKEAAIRAIREGQTKYTAVAGTPALRRAIADRLAADFGTDYTPEEIVVSTGGKQSIFNAMVATLNPGDEVIIPTPAWVSYPDIVTLADGKPVLVPTDPEAGFKMTARQLTDAITPRTKWLMLNSPCNPTGSAYTKSELRALCDVLLDHPDVWVFTDDIYAKLVYDGFVAQTVVQVEPRLRDRTVTMNGMSKAYAMTGWRVGYTAAPVALTKAMTKLQGQSTSNPCSIAQAAACEAASGPQDFIAVMVETYRARRDLVVAAINQTPHLHCHVPQGAFYVFASMKDAIGLTSAKGAKITSDEAFVTALLEETGVAAVHGAAFLCPGYFRISYATDTDTLHEACRRIATFCNGLHA